MSQIPRGFAESDVPAEPDPSNMRKCWGCDHDFEIDKGYNSVCCSEKCYGLFLANED